MGGSGVEASRSGSVRSGCCGLGRAAESRLFATGSGLRGTSGGIPAAHLLALAAAGSGYPRAFHVGGTIVASTFTASPASPV